MQKDCDKYKITKEIEDLGFHDDIIDHIELNLKESKAIITIQTIEWKSYEKLYERLYKEPLSDNAKKLIGTGAGAICYRSTGKLVQIEATIEEVLTLNLENMQCATEISEVVVYNTKENYKILTIVTIEGRIELRVKDYMIKDIVNTQQTTKAKKKNAHNTNTK